VQITLIMALDHRKSIQAWISLTHSEGWRNKRRKEMQGLPVLSEVDDEAFHSPSAYQYLLAFYSLENRHRGHLAQGTRWF
jgi:hypothetical protein